MPFERTLVIMKPSIIKRGIESELFLWYRQTGLNIADVRIIHPNIRWWKDFYREHRKKSFFPKLIKFMTSGISLALVMEGENAVQAIRTLNGATDPKEAAEKTIRATFASDGKLPDNAVHGSANVKDAKRELDLIRQHRSYTHVR